MSSTKVTFAPEVEKAFSALAEYRAGSARGALLPLDKAVFDASADGRVVLEERLLQVLASCSSEPGKEYICGKLSLIGGEKSVPALAALLSDPHASTTARTALQSNPSAKAVKALRDSLKVLGGLQKAGVVSSLGAKRDTGSVRNLVRLLRDSDVSVASAATNSLGQIGGSRALRALEAFRAQAPASLAPIVADALKLCTRQV